MSEQVNKKKKKRRKKHYLLRLLVLAIFIGAAVFAAHLEYFNITEIAISGNDDITDEEVLDLSQIKMGKSIFDVHPFFAQRRIATNMYVDKVDIDRKLPGRIEIKITERTGMTELRNGNQYVIADSEGKVLAIKKKFCRVALVEGLKVKSAKEGSKLKTSDDTAYEKIRTVVDLNEKNDLYFKKIYINGNTVHAYIYDELQCKGKYSNLVKCIKSGILRSVVYDLYNKGTKKGTINVSDDNYCFFTP